MVLTRPQINIEPHTALNPTPLKPKRKTLNPVYLKDRSLWRPFGILCEFCGSSGSEGFGICCRLDAHVLEGVKGGQEMLESGRVCG